MNPIDLSELVLQYGKRYDVSWNAEDGKWQAFETDNDDARARPQVRVSTGIEDETADWIALQCGLAVATLPVSS